MKAISGFWAISAVAIALLLFGCGRKRSTEPPPVVVVLADSSASTERMVIRRRYQDGFNAILTACAAGTRIEAATITANSLADQTFSLDVTLPVYNPLADSPLTFKLKRGAILNRSRRQVEALFNQLCNERGTDLVNAFDLPAKVFAADENRGRPRILVVFSDMIQQGGGLDFSSMPLTRQQTRSILVRLKNESRLPDLSGVSVWIAGATADDGIASDRIVSIRQFWLAYFAACGAELPARHYGPTLLDYPTSPRSEEAGLGVLQ